MALSAWIIFECITMAVRCMPSADLDNDRKMDVVFDLSEIE